ncbi:MAG: phosphatase PAP2 family protein [Treponema sp.]|nr:phosphatase PAP2 family protein [Treponema sp.]
MTAARLRLSDKDKIMNRIELLGKSTAVCLLLLSSVIPLRALDTADSDAEIYTGSLFRLSPVTDGVLLGTGLALDITAKITENKLSQISFADENGFDTSCVNQLDRLFMMPYSKTIDYTSTVLTCTTMLTPVLLLTTGKKEWLTIGTMYAESLMFSWGIKEMMKNGISRYRPYMYESSIPADKAENDDCMQSFPSGHTSLAFTGASFTTFVFCRYYPDSPWTIPFIAGSYTLAAATAALRITGGNHYLTDVLAGAVVGTVSGLLIPWLHTSVFQRKNSKAGTVKLYAFEATLYGIDVVIRF